MEEFLTLLRETALFSGIPEDILCTEVLPHRQYREYQKDRFILEPQQKAPRFGVVAAGRVHIMHLFPEGNYSLMSVLTVGKILAADLICTRSQLSPYHAVTAEHTRVIWFPSELLTEPGLLREEYRLRALSNLLVLLSHENMKKEYRLAILSQKGLRERIMTYLRMQAARRGKDTFEISFSREELAAFLCVNRSALSHELSLLQQEGLIRFRKKEFTVCQMGLAAETRRPSTKEE